MNSTVNVAGVERWASALGGAALAAFGVKQLKDRSPAGAALAAAGSALILRGATGHCHVYAAAGINTAARRRRYARGARRRSRRQRRRGRHHQRQRRCAVRLLAQLLAAAEVHDQPRVGHRDRRSALALDREGAGGPDGPVGRRNHQRDSGRADRLAHARRRRRRQRRIGALHAARRRTRHRGPRADAVRPAGRQDRRDRRVAARPRSGADDSRRPAALQAADGNRRGADHRRDSRAASSRCSTTTSSLAQSYGKGAL